MNGNKVFGGVNLFIDKMGGLIADSGENKITINPWDFIRDDNGLNGIILCDGIKIWDGLVLTNDEIYNLIKPFQEDGITPIPFSRRPGKTGTPKKIGKIRLQTNDGKKFEIVKCNSGDELLGKITSSNFGQINIILISKIFKGEINTILFCPKRDLIKFNKNFS